MQQLARDEAGNLWDVSGGQPVLVQPAGMTAAPAATVVPPNPMKVAEAEAERRLRLAAEARAAASDERERQRFNERNAPSRPTPPAGFVFVDPSNPAAGVRRIPQVDERGAPVLGGKQLREGDGKALEKDVATFETLDNALRSFQDDFAGNKIGGGIETKAEKLLGWGTEGQGDWWANFRTMDNQIRNDLFGATLTPSEQASYAATSVSENMLPEKVRENLTRRREILQKAITRKVARFKAAGFNPAEVEAITGQYTPQFSGQLAPASGQTRREPDPKADALVNRMVRLGAPVEEVDAALQDLGFSPLNETDRAKYGEAVAFAREQPGYAGSFSAATREVPTTATERALATPGGAAVGSYLDAASGGLPSLLVGQEGRDKLQAVTDANPTASLVGGGVGGITAALGAGKLLGATGLGSWAAANPTTAGLTGDLAYGALYGFNTADEGAGAAGVATGALGSLAGSLAGNAVARGIGSAARTRPGLFGLNAVRDAVTRLPIGPTLPRIAGADAPNVAERTVLGAVDRAGIQNVTGQLTEAANLNIPMSIADTAAQPRALAGSALRFSADAMEGARESLLDRNRGQFDRLTAAVERDLGPAVNIPKLSDDLSRKAATDAKPLYEQAYAAGVVQDPGIDELLQHPDFAEIFRVARQMNADDQAIAKARGSAVIPSIAMAPDGTPLPEVRTLDYIKRAMDRKIDAAYAGDSAAKMRLPFLKDARKLLLERLDTAVPDYGAARKAYAGPLEAREALERGQQAFRDDPQQVALDVASAAPADLSQMQLGYRGALTDRAATVRDASNPFEATLGTPAARDRLEAMYPGNAGNTRLLRQREMENDLARSTMELIGNSMTQGRKVADDQFMGGYGPSLAADAAAAVATGGVSGFATAAQAMARTGFRDYLRMGVGKRAEKKAAEVAPMLLNTSPVDSIQIVQDLMAKDAAFRALVEATTPKRLGVFGRGAGVTGTGMAVR